MLNAELRSDEDPRVSSARMLQLRPGQCATGHDGGVGGQPRRIDASAPIAAPHRCVSPSRRGTRSALRCAQTCRAVSRVRPACCMPAGHARAHTHDSSIDMYNNDVGKKSAQKFMKQTGDLKAATLYFAS